MKKLTNKTLKNIRTKFMIFLTFLLKELQTLYTNIIKKVNLDKNLNKNKKLNKNKNENKNLNKNENKNLNKNLNRDTLDKIKSYYNQLNILISQEQNSEKKEKFLKMKDLFLEKYQKYL